MADQSLTAAQLAKAKADAKAKAAAQGHTLPSRPAARQSSPTKKATTQPNDGRVTPDSISSSSSQRSSPADKSKAAAKVGHDAHHPRPRPGPPTPQTSDLSSLKAGSPGNTKTGAEQMPPRIAPQPPIGQGQRNIGLRHNPFTQEAAALPGRLFE